VTPEQPLPAPLPAVVEISYASSTPVAVTAATPAGEQSPAPPADPATPPKQSAAAAKREDAKAKLHDLATRHHLSVIAIGNGTACRETEEFVSEVIRDKLPELAYVIVNEAGASVYSASTIGREEFPDHDATVRGTISIGRRLARSAQRTGQSRSAKCRRRPLSA